MSEQKVAYPVVYQVTYQERLSRLTTFFRAFMIIPHTIVLAIIGIGAGVIDFIAWWAILFTGKFPKGMFDFMAGYLRWSSRYCAYSLLLTDKYPPYSMK